MSWKTGIYKILNNITGDCYVGSAVYLNGRWKKHLLQLSRKNHPNDHLQKAYNKYGMNSFDFIVLLYCEPLETIRYEQFFIDTINPYYNICRIAGSSLGRIGSEKQRQYARSKKGIPRLEYVKDKIRRSMLGQHYTEDRIKNISKGRKGIASKRADNFCYFKPKKFSFISPTGAEFIGFNLKKFCEDLNIPYKSMSSLSRKEIDSYMGWRRKN